MPVRPTKVSGRGLETDVTENLLQHSFWAMMIANGISGQPFDIIACKDNVGYAIECKEVLSSGRFNPSRIEPNQHFAFEIWKDCGNKEGWFAFGMADGEIYMVESETVLGWTKPMRADLGIPIWEWLAARA